MAPTQIRVLLIDDDGHYAGVLKERLSQQSNPPFIVECADRLQIGMDQLAQTAADVILLDLFLPDSSGLETFERTRAQVPEVPIVILTVFDDDVMALEAVRKGAQDYLVKGQVDEKMLSRMIRYAIERHRLQAALRSLSMLDELTGLYNRRGFLNLAAQHLKLAQRTLRGLSLVYVDLDGLKQINDTFGHQEGDKALMATADILRGTFRSSDVLARIGGDEFAVLAIEARKDSNEVLGPRLQDKVAEHNAQRSLSYQLSVSEGMVYLDPQQAVSLEELMAQADQALYEQKRAKRA